MFVLAGCSVPTLSVDTRRNERVQLSQKVSMGGQSKPATVAAFFIDSVRAGEVVLLSNEYDKPLLILPGFSSGFLCVYDFDVGLRVLVVESMENRAGRTESNESELRTIVLSSTLPVRYATLAELDAVLRVLDGLNESDLRRYAVPTFALGPFKLYPRKKQVVERLWRLRESVTLSSRGE